jgi:predicted dinucleotide-binding enzyme
MPSAHTQGIPAVMSNPLLCRSWPPHGGLFVIAKETLMSCNRSLLAPCLLVVLALVQMPVARAATVALIGTGDFSSAMGPRFAALGHRVIYGSRTPERADVRQLVLDSGENASAATPSEAAAAADLILLAVPWTAAEQVVRGLGDLSGKILIDPMNPRIVADDGFRDYAAHISSAEQLQELAPAAFVVKALNTISLDAMRDPNVIGATITIPIAGNDAAAKKTVADIIAALGYQPVDVGPVRYAHVIEGLYLLRSNARDILGTHFDYDFRVREHATPQEIR